MNNEKETVLELKQICKSFRQGSQKLDVLTGVDLEIKSGEIVALIGPSGSGKSTLLQIAGLLETPSSGEIYLNRQNCSKLGDGLRTLLRRDFLGFVYQYHNLLPDFSAEENVMLPQLIAGRKAKAARERAAWLLERLNLGSRLKHRPAEMSGGRKAIKGKFSGTGRISSCLFLFFSEVSVTSRKHRVMLPRILHYSVIQNLFKFTFSSGSCIAYS